MLILTGVLVLYLLVKVAYKLGHADGYVQGRIDEVRDCQRDSIRTVDELIADIRGGVR